MGQLIPSAKKGLRYKVRRQWQNRVRELRYRSFIQRQEDLSRMTGIPRETISAIENNKIFLSATYALLIAEALGCKLDDLYCRKQDQFARKGSR